VPLGYVMIRILRGVDRTREDAHRAASATSGAAAGVHRDAVTLGEVEQVRVLSLPGERASRPTKVDLDRLLVRSGSRGSRRAYGRRSERFMMDVVLRYAPSLQGRNEARHHGWRAADIELVAAIR
jgi:hypothetical protein